MYRNHPLIQGQTSANTQESVEDTSRKTKQQKNSQNESVRRGVPKGLGSADLGELASSLPRPQSAGSELFRSISDPRAQNVPTTSQRSQQFPSTRPQSPVFFGPPAGKALHHSASAGKLWKGGMNKLKASFAFKRHVQKEVLQQLKFRNGSVLNSRSLIKVDYFPEKEGHGCIPMTISGARNFRKTPVGYIFGVAQPSIAGIRGILNILGTGREYAKQPSSAVNFAIMHRDYGNREVVWINMREEPVLYVNGRSTVLRDIEEPFRNLNDFRGISSDRIEELEWRLKEDVVAETTLNGGNIMLHTELKRGNLDAIWEAVRVDEVKTTEEVFFTFRMEGYKVQYERLPTTPEQPPPKHYFDQLVAHLLSRSLESTIIFNCQTGQSRSTFGMVAACLVQMWRGSSPFIDSHAHKEDENNDDKQKRHMDPVPYSRTNSVPYPSTTVDKNGNPITRVLSGRTLNDVKFDLEMEQVGKHKNKKRVDMDMKSVDMPRQLLAGWYQPVIKVIRHLSSGRQSKEHVDHFVDQCSHLQNMREIIFKHRSKAIQRQEAGNRYKLMRAGYALIRYILLIMFDSYLNEQVQKLLTPNVVVGMSAAQGNRFEITFENWLHDRPELRRILNDISSHPRDALESVPLYRSVGLKTFTEKDIDKVIDKERYEMLQAMTSRRGSMLNTDAILKKDLLHQKQEDEKAAADMLIRGAKNFRVVPGTHISGVCTPTFQAAFSIVRYIGAAYPSKHEEPKTVMIDDEVVLQKKIVWTNLRDEPVVYINKRPFSLRSINRPFTSVNSFGTIDSLRLEAAEVRLKEDVLNDAARHNGRVLVHIETAEGELEPVWQDVSDEDDIMTPKEVFERVVEAGLDVDYVRLPMWADRTPSPAKIDELLNRVQAYGDDPDAHFIFNCQMGSGRSTLASIIAYMELHASKTKTGLKLMESESSTVYDKASKFSTLNQNMNINIDMEIDRNADRVGDATIDMITDSELGTNTIDDNLTTSSNSSVESETNSTKQPDPEYSSILALARVLPHGVKTKRWADHVIDLCGEINNIRKSIAYYSDKASHARTSERSEDHVDRALTYMRRYFVIICVAAYLWDRHIGSDGTTMKQYRSYSEWYAARPELTTLYNHLNDAHALMVQQTEVLSTPPEDTSEFAQPSDNAMIDERQQDSNKEEEMREYVANREGMVLIRGSILKSDHFPGCNRLKGAKLVLEGAPNFRPILGPSETGELTSHLAYGTGIPTYDGVKNIIKYLMETAPGSRSTEKRQICWINLREEPILYVNGRPFVLRKFEHPFANLEYTGINRERVEGMEDRLKLDVISEITQNGGRFLLHDEDDIGLTPVWEHVDITPSMHGVMTPRDLYNAIREELQVDVTDYRVPITDEQAPKMSDFDKLINIARRMPHDAQVVVNCQMGRGRTTTGLVVVTALKYWQQERLMRIPTLIERNIEFAKHVKSKVRKATFNLLADDEILSREELVYRNGEMKSVLHLTRLLSGGTDAKLVMDAIIDMCDSMQNLREAIYDLKVLSEKKGQKPMKLAATCSRGAHYMKRYYQLVIFAAYLLSINPADVQRAPMVSFSAWTKDRVEIVNATRRLRFP